MFHRFSLLLLTLWVTPLFAGDAFLTQISRWGTGPYRDVAVSGNYAFAVGDAGVNVYDLQFPSTPFRHAFIETGIVTVAEVRDDLLVLGTFEGIRFYNISDPVTPILLGTAAPGGFISQLTLDGDLLYVSGFFSGLTILDISDLKSVTTRANIPIIAADVTVVNATAYVADESGELRFFDVSNPDNPTEIGTPVTLDQPTRVIYHKGLLYVLERFPGGLKVYDLIGTVFPKEVGSLSIGQLSLHMEMRDGVLFIAQNEAGVQAVDISDPTKPRLAGRYNTPRRANSLALLGDDLAVADREGGLVVVNATNIDNLTFRGEDDVSLLPFDLHKVGDRLYLLEDDNLHIFDVENPHNIIRLGGFRAFDGLAHFAIHNDRAFVAGFAGDLYIWDLSNPQSPVSKGFYDGPTSSLAMHNGLLYWGREDLTIVDPSNTVVLDIVGTLPRPEGANTTSEFSFVGGSAIIGHADTHFQIADVSDPANPQTLAAIPLPLQNFAVNDGILYGYSNKSQDFHGFDLSVPNQPNQVFQVKSNQTNLDLELFDGFLFGGFFQNTPDQSTLHVQDVFTPDNPVAVSQTGQRNVNGIAADENALYTAEDFNLVIYEKLRRYQDLDSAYQTWGTDGDWFCTGPNPTILEFAAFQNNGGCQ